MSSQYFHRLADAVRDPVIDNGRVALLSIFAPFFDRGKKNIRWSRDAFA